MSFPNTKLSQGQIKGTGKSHLGEELTAVEAAIQAAVGGATYESRAELSLTDIGGLISKEADGRLGLDVNVKGNGFSVGGLTGITAGTATFTNTAGGAITGGSISVTGMASAASASIAGPASVGTLVVQGSGQSRGDFVVGNGVEGTGSLTVWGDLTVKGNTVTLDTTNLVVEDDRIVMAKGFANKDGAGFVLGSDSGARKMVWDNTAGKWAISDGVKSVDFKAGDKMLVDSMGVHGSADGLALDSAGKVQFKDSFMPGPMDLSKSGEFAPVFGPGAWADGLGLIGALNKVRLDSGASLLAASGSLVAALDAERIRAMAAEAALQAEIDAEEAARAAADTAHDAAIAAEIARAQAAELVITNNLSAEVARAQAAEGVLDGKIATEKSRAEAAELVLTNALSAEVAARIADVNAEEARALAAELVLDGKITTEKSRAEAAELVLTNAIAAEVSRATAAEGILDGKITAEKNRAEAAELVLTNGLAAEVSRATAAELVLDGKITTEKNRAEAAEATLTANLAAEVSRAQAAEADLAADIAAEESRALAAEAVLDGKITTLSGKITTQAARIFVAVIPNGPDLAADSNLTGYPAAEFVMPVGKVSANYDVYLNGQQMMWNSDYVFVAGKVQFKFALKAGDVVRFREF
jgi:hypothetical protein